MIQWSCWKKRRKKGWGRFYYNYNSKTITYDHNYEIKVFLKILGLILEFAKFN